MPGCHLHLTWTGRSQISVSKGNSPMLCPACCSPLLTSARMSLTHATQTCRGLLMPMPGTRPLRFLHLNFSPRTCTSMRACNVEVLCAVHAAGVESATIRSPIKVCTFIVPRTVALRFAWTASVQTMPLLNLLPMQLLEADVPVNHPELVGRHLTLHPFQGLHMVNFGSPVTCTCAVRGSLVGSMHWLPRVVLLTSACRKFALKVQLAWAYGCVSTAPKVRILAVHL